MLTCLGFFYYYYYSVKGLNELNYTQSVQKDSQSIASEATRQSEKYIKTSSTGTTTSELSLLDKPKLGTSHAQCTCYCYYCCCCWCDAGV